MSAPSSAANGEMGQTAMSTCHHLTPLGRMAGATPPLPSGTQQPSVSIVLMAQRTAPIVGEGAPKSARRLTTGGRPVGIG